jgi:alkanesulfonate monooxygenase SsuD/methylene tetrahydromethanopterin reductase-like flavin-dependent oxidoreductase (luciferase family)
VQFAITLGQLNPRAWNEVAVLADDLGFESLWLPEHLVFPDEIRGQLIPGEEHPPVPPSTPVFDACAYLSFLAARTEHIRLGTFVYLLGIRHPFIGARAFATLDVVSSGRAICGVGAGWLVTEWEAVGLDPRTRGARLDEHIDICRRLWTEDAATTGDGWIGMSHTPESAGRQVAKLRALCEEAGRVPEAVEVTCMGACDGPGDVAAWEAAGVDRLIVVPWRRTSDAVAGLSAFAATHLA